MENFSETMKVEAFRTFIIIYEYFVFQYEWLSSNVKLVLHEATIRSVMTYAAPRWNLRQAPTLWNCSGCKTKFSARLAFSKAHTKPWSICGFQNSIRIRFYHKIKLPVSRSHTKWDNENFRNIEQGDFQHTEPGYSYWKPNFDGDHFTTGQTISRPFCMA
jgi:hypothetical protein